MSGDYQSGWEDGYEEGRDVGIDEAWQEAETLLAKMRTALTNARSLVSAHTGPDDQIAAACLKEIDEALSA